MHDIALEWAFRGFFHFKRNQAIQSMLLVGLACIVLTNAYVAKADFEFSTPTNLGPIVNSSDTDVCSSISADGLSLFFASFRPGGHGEGDIFEGDIYVATRETRNEPWGEPINLGSTVNSSWHDAGPSISFSGLTLYFFSDRPGGHGNQWDIWMTTRQALSDPWSTPVNLGPMINGTYSDFTPCISKDGLTLYFSSDRPGGHGSWDIWQSKHVSANDDWGNPVNLGPNVNSSSYDQAPSISADGLTLFFESGRFNNTDIWVTRRATTEDEWSTAVNLGPPVNSPNAEKLPNISADGSTLYFSFKLVGDDASHFDLWQVSILPIVDFNADGIVDGLDVCMMLDYWHTDEPLYDIAPMPFGDGIVDVKDLVLISEHLTPKEVDPNAVTP